MRIVALVALLILMAGIAAAQFKSQEQTQESPSQSFVEPSSSTSSFLGLIDPDRFSMRQSLSMGYMSGGGMAMSLASFTNSMRYQLADPLSVRMDLTLQASPFGTTGSVSQSALSKLFISNAELSYHPWDNAYVKFQYRQVPYSQWNMGYPYGFYGSSVLLGDQ
jgi:opacity protein-like surface antigen